MKWWETILIAFWLILILGIGFLGFLEVWFDYKPGWIDHCLAKEDVCDQYDEERPVILYHVLGGLVFPIIIVIGGIGLIVSGLRKMRKKMRADK